ncbi:saccharopine dehydrogenase-like NADP-dependent oxidoreductase [Nitrospirillum amazonense]|uniref:Saccharopine dehydrogenase-like NADP-dependent oxidoreductase n=1 Tax=Nitrospirillum amazonense TaxID=28077 RepID=A0A560JFH6_9PROT|nr:SDR family oxidoreductase [Nitrospirillum amazonense]TWB69279.1 saccharopine dehydrogenase-like NADP-dependent oxidoreductase [Nitrospirillum amazonense]
MSKPALRVLIIGGYGTFGGRIATLLADEPGLTLVIAGRSAGKAAAFCAALGRARGATRLSALAFDRDGDLTPQLSAAAPDLVIDATGPFQVYGDAPYRVVQACLDLGLPYLDLADGADFVMGIQAFDGAARARGIPVLSGVSSFPVLTAAAARHLTQGWTAVTGLMAGVAPSPYAVVGANVLRAIASYAGRPVPLMRDGAWTQGQAMTEVRRRTIAPPGVLPLRNTRFALVEVPDLRVLPPLWPGLRDIWVGAGTRPESVHRVMTTLAWLVRLRILPSLLPLAPLFHWGAGIFRWGEHRGGMVVEVTGRDAQDQPASRSWHMVAEGDDGPYIPAMPAAALVRRWLAGSPPPPGARAAVTDLELADYQPLFAPREIHTGVRDTSGPEAALFAQVMGREAWDRQPAAWRALHTLPADGPATWRGRAAVTRGRSPLAGLAALVVGFPPSGTDVPVTVTLSRTAGDGELWARDFAGRRFASRQSLGRGRNEHLVVESFDPAAFAMALVADADGVTLVLRRWTLFGLPLPLWLAPRSDAAETVAPAPGGDRFHFDVRLSHPLAGLIVHYRGWLDRGWLGPD